MPDEDEYPIVIKKVIKTEYIEYTLKDKDISILPEGERDWLTCPRLLISYDDGSTQLIYPH